MSVRHITSNPKARVLYERLDILDTIDAALERDPTRRQSISIVAEELGSSSLPFNEFLEHLAGLQKQGVARFKVNPLHPHNPWYDTVLISKINKRILLKLRRKTRRRLDKERGRTSSSNSLVSLVSRAFAAMGSINRVIIGLSAFLVAVTGVWRYGADIWHFLKTLI